MVQKKRKKEVFKKASEKKKKFKLICYAKYIPSHNLST
jgi:hypothetical protein